MNGEISAQHCVLQARDVSKSFPGVKALDGVRLDVRPGEVHALMGENGAGKSTLMKILAGLHRPDGGQILFRGQPVDLRSPHAALKAGIAMIHQELMTFRELTVAENIFMGQERASRLVGWLDQRRMNAEANEWLARLGLALSPARPMKDLRVAEMQAVEIARALMHRSAVLIMDEPTSALAEHEAARLFEVIVELKQRGVAVIYITHKLEEVFRIADTVTVLRDGRYIATHDVRDITPDRLIALMVGRELNAPTSKPLAAKGELVLEVRGFSRRGQFQDVSFEVREGEILGLAGLMGAGRTELVSAIYGLQPVEQGALFVRGKPTRIGSPHDALANGIAMVSEDRKECGLFPRMSVKHNITLSSLRRCCPRFVISRPEENRIADGQIRALSIKTPDRDRPVTELSGGNQQKVVLARALLTNPAVLILDEPTRGIDVAAKAEVHRLIAELAAQGKGIIVVSSELPELFALSDRILVMREGRMVAELDARQTTQEAVMRHAMPA